MKKSTKIVLIIVLLILIGCLSGWLFVNRMVDSALDKLEQGEVIDIDDAGIVQPVEEVEVVRNVTNFLLFGCDSSTGNDSGADERSDAIKIVSLDYDNKKVKLGNLQRDVVYYAPGDYQGFLHLNWAYWFGGPKLAIQTVNSNFDLDITKYVVINFTALEEIVNAVGGVDIVLSNAEANTLGLSPGLNTLYGQMALRYARTRYIDSDFVRVERQNVIIKCVVNKLKNSNVNTILGVINSVLPYIKTNLTNEEIKSYLMDVLTFDLGDIESYTEPVGEYNDICNCPGLGGYLVRSYSDMAKHLHAQIYGEDYRYSPSEQLLDIEKSIYDRYGEFSK